MCETLPQISLTVLSPGRSKIKGLRFRQVNVRKSTLIEQTLFCQFNLIFETAANWGWVGELKYLRPWNTIEIGQPTWILWGFIEQSESQTKCTQLNAVIIFGHYFFGVPSLVGYIYSFTHIRIKREQTLSGKMRFVAHRAMKKTCIARNLMKPAWNTEE